MAIWLVDRTDDIGYEETIQMVIEAKTEGRARELFAEALWVFGAPYDEDGRKERLQGIAASAKATRLGATDSKLTERDRVIVHSRASA